MVLLLVIFNLLQDGYRLMIGTRRACGCSKGGAFRAIIRFKEPGSPAGQFSA